jgi:hypothetical protein
MMTDGDVSAPDRSGDLTASTGDTVAAQAAILELLHAQGELAPRSAVARVFGMSPLSHETHALYRGVVGEIEVGEALDRLGPEWAVRHALPVEAGLGDIDHLVIGPAGVFIIATKNHSGLNVWASQRTLMVAGVRQPHIRNMEYEMGSVERILSAASGSAVEVSGILAVVAAKSLVVREKHRDVAVLAASHLVTWLQRHKRVLSAEQVASISTAASRASTWSDVEPVAAPPLLVREQFEALRSEVRHAWRVQMTWAIGTTVVGVGAFAGITYAILMNAIGSFGF